MFVHYPHKLLLFIILIFITLFLLPNGIVAKNYIIPEPGSYDLKYFSEDPSSYLGGNEGVVVGDINEDGIDDFVVESYDDHKYVFFGSNELKTGDKDLATSTNYSVRIDSNCDSDYNQMLIDDINNDSYSDLLFICNTGFGSVPLPGHIYIFYSEIFSQFSNTTGNTLDLNESSDYSIHIYNIFGDSGYDQDIFIEDINNNSQNDLIFIDDKSSTNPG